MDFDDLKRFLVELPSLLNYQDSSSVKQLVFNALYYSATDQANYLNCLFPDIFISHLQNLQASNFDLKVLKTVAPFNKPALSQSTSFSHPPGKPCARLFKCNDTVYRCEDCGFDDTCVLCAYCFNEEDHIDHSVQMYTSSGDSGGVCDCGDPEAFVNPLHCKCSTQKVDSEAALREKDIENLDPKILASTIEICLDYILDVTNLSISTLPMIHDLMKVQNIINPRKWSNHASLPSSHYGGATDKNSDSKWYLLLWNDEFHDVNQAVYAIKRCTGIADDKAVEIASKIDKEGYCILMESGRCEGLLRFKNIVEEGGLIATIVSARDYMRDFIVRGIFFWLEDILSSTNNVFKARCQRILSELLLDKNFVFSTAVPADFLSPVKEVLKLSCYRNGLPLDNKFTNNDSINSLNYSDSDLNYQEEDFQDDSVSGSSNRSEEHFSRFQSLLIFQIRFPKLVRQKLVPILIPLLVSNADLKQVFARQFTEIYPRLLTIFAYSDREDHLNLISEIAVQLYTCPVTVQNLLNNVGIGFILNPVITIIEESSSFFDGEQEHKVFSFSGEDSHRERTIQMAVARAIHDFGLFTSSSFSGDAIAMLMYPQNMAFIISFLKLFQGYLPLSRKLGEHVEQESFLFRYHIAISVPIFEALRNLAFSQYDNPVSDASISTILELSKGSKIDEDQRVREESYRVSNHHHGLVYPLTTFLSLLTQARGVEDALPLLKEYERQVISISSESLWNIVLASQIKVGFWIRNGLSASRQASMYFGADMSEFTFSCDFHLQQLAFLVSNDPSGLLTKMLKRWEIFDWFTNEQTFDKTVYEDRFFSIVEMFIWIAYNLLTDRSKFVPPPPKEQAAVEAKRLMAYTLCEKARSYSSLKAKVTSRVSSLAEFDNLLYSIADYQPPSALMDTGLYKLKESMYLVLDPMSLFSDLTKFHSMSETLRKYISRSKGIKEEDVILTPIIDKCGLSEVDNHIGEFAKTSLFMKITYKFLRVAVDNSNEVYLPQLLHLIHAIIVDDESIHGKQYLNPVFVDIPVCDLLVTIVESGMSSSIIRKADYIVQQLLSKDHRIMENLVSCFGEEHVAKFRNRSASLSANADASSKRKVEERKRKILKKFSKKQNQFLSQNKEMREKHEENLEKDKADHRVCVLCGEQEDADKPFGVLIVRTRAPIFWKFGSKVTKGAVSLWNDDLYTDTDKSDYGTGYDCKDNLCEDFEQVVLSSCGHGIHFECYKRGAGRSKNYPCPLCHNLYRSFLPTIVGKAPNSTMTRLQSILYGEPVAQNYSSIIHYGQTSQKKTFLRYIYTFESSTLNSDIFKELELATDKRKLEYMSWATEFASTIEMCEIATRLNGVSAYSGFLSQIPKFRRTLLSSLFRVCILIPELTNEEFSPYPETYQKKEKSEEENDISNYQNGVFSRTLLLFFKTNESLATLARMGICEIIAGVFHRFSTMHYCYVSGDIKEDDCDSDCSSNPAFDPFCSLYEYYLVNLMDSDSDPDSELDIYLDDIKRRVFRILQQILCVYLRKVIIFQDILLGQQVGDNFISDPRYSEMEEEIKKQKTPFGLDPLTKILGIPTLEEILRRIFTHYYDSFERETFMTVCKVEMPKDKANNNSQFMLEYPGVVHLTTLPQDYQKCLLRLSNLDAEDKLRCLVCGEWIRKNKLDYHMLECASDIGVFFNPKKTVLRIYISINQTPIALEVMAPYLTKHGEVKTFGYKGKAMLSEFRFKELNKLWVNQGLYAFVTRNLFGNSTGLTVNGLGINLNRGGIFNNNAVVDENDEDGTNWNDDNDEDEFIIM
ncbi:UBR1 [Candida oxycetoniae]|uniref:E3 ubiquitin-protein ligase n=1 Tax=Candida oxycetoniae TaxID=497107 RepID=A0AAI9STF1_9ASCO|nr:UBR1 [Candida oxycetoniae]KAI3402716.2 UBR1 [Candida oxycetoniae]